jgi:hypothetical protein
VDGTAVEGADHVAELSTSLFVDASLGEGYELTIEKSFQSPRYTRGADIALSFFVVVAAKTKAVSVRVASEVVAAATLGTRLVLDERTVVLFH